MNPHNDEKIKARSGNVLLFCLGNDQQVNHACFKLGLIGTIVQL